MRSFKISSIGTVLQKQTTQGKCYHEQWEWEETYQVAVVLHSSIDFHALTILCLLLNRLPQAYSIGLWLSEK